MDKDGPQRLQDSWQSQSEHTKQKGELEGDDSVHEQVAEQDMQQVDLPDHLPQPKHTMVLPESALDDAGQVKELPDQRWRDAVEYSSRETVYARRTASE